MNKHLPDWQRFVPTLTEVVDPGASEVTSPALPAALVEQVDALVEQVVAKQRQAMQHHMQAEFTRLAQRLAERLWAEWSKQWQAELSSNVRQALTEALQHYQSTETSQPAPERK